MHTTLTGYIHWYMQIMLTVVTILCISGIEKVTSQQNRAFYPAMCDKSLNTTGATKNIMSSGPATFSIYILKSLVSKFEI